MITKLSNKGQMVFSKAILEMAGLAAGDELEVGDSGGEIVLCKPEALNDARGSHLLKEGRKLPQLATEDEAIVADAAMKVVFDANVVVSACF